VECFSFFLRAPCILQTSCLLDRNGGRQSVQLVGEPRSLIDVRVHWSEKHKTVSHHNTQCLGISCGGIDPVCPHGCTWAGLEEVAHLSRSSHTVGPANR
jgi:hypothetical protein